MASDRKQKQSNSIPIRFFDGEEPRLSEDDMEIEGDASLEQDPGQSERTAAERADFGGPDLAELIASRAELKRLQAALSEAQEGSARRQADFENYRKRIERERGEAHSRVVADVARKLLPVVDNLDRALDAEKLVESSESRLERRGPLRLERPRLVVGTKADIADPAAPGPALRMSAVTGQGVTDVVRRLAALVDEARAAEPEPEGFVVIHPEVEGVTVAREGEHEFRIAGRQAERAVALSDVTDRQALAYIDDRMKRLGVSRALARAGAQAGDVVHIGAFSFEYEPDV
jgi:Obg family GTPase CgtA-like protein